MKRTTWPTRYRRHNADMRRDAVFGFPFCSSAVPSAIPSAVPSEVPSKSRQRLLPSLATSLWQPGEARTLRAPVLGRGARCTRAHFFSMGAFCGVSRFVVCRKNYCTNECIFFSMKKIMQIHFIVVTCTSFDLCVLLLLLLILILCPLPLRLKS